MSLKRCTNIPAIVDDSAKHCASSWLHCVRTPVSVYVPTYRRPQLSETIFEIAESKKVLDNTDEYEGTGIGLATVHCIISHQGVRI